MNTTTSPMSIEHYEDVYALWTATEGLCLGDADSKDRIARYLERNQGFSCVAHASGALVGAVLCGHDGRRAFVHHLAVAPDFRGRGIAKRMVGQSLSALNKAGIQLSHIFVLNLHDAAITFWEYNGWELRRDLGAFRKRVD